MDRYILQQSTDDPNIWYATDTEAGLVCQFEQRRFNATQRYTFLEDVNPPISPTELAKLPNGIANWLATFHYDLAMGEATEIEPAETRGASGINIGAYIYPTEMSNRLRIGRQVAYYRNQAGLSVRQLADATGLAYSNISKIENGKYNVSVEILDRICKALGVTINLNPAQE